MRVIKVVGSGTRKGRLSRRAIVALAILAGLGAWLLTAQSAVRATSDGNPYSVPNVVSTNPNPHIIETTLTAETATVAIGTGVLANVDTFNGEIPGPTFHLHVGDTVIVHFKNDLSFPSGIHWHGVELSSEVDGTPFTQDSVPPGGTFLYKFKMIRPGIFWYHPHHDLSTNQVFRGMYGMMVVDDPNDSKLERSGTLPPDSQTKQIVLSDTTVCKTPGTNDTSNYPNAATQPWVGNPNGAPPTPAQNGPVPKSLCETPTAIDDNGNIKASSYNSGDIPAIQQAGSARTNEGQTVLTNGKNVGGRAGSPSAPGALDSGASTLNVRPGQGLRLQMLNAATIRYFRLILTDSSGNQIPLIRVGGEGGLLDNAVEEGGTPQGFNTGYSLGEILLPPGSRADVVAAIPSSATGVLTMWTEDYQRTGNGYSDIPTVPVMHLNVTGSPVVPAYSISAGTPLRAATGDPVAVLGPPTGTLLDPTTFSPPKPGMASQNIAFTVSGAGGSVGVNGVSAPQLHDAPDYMTVPHVGSTRYAKIGDILELQMTNSTGASHPFHLHGFSIQPISLTKSGGPDYTWPYHEFRDNVDVPSGYTLTFRVKIEDRPKADGVSPGGAYGRWAFHCHIFFHAELGMISELVVTAPNGVERPDVSVDSGDVHVTAGHTATVTGRFFDPNGQSVTLKSSVGKVHIDTPPTSTTPGHYTWTFKTGPAPSQIVYVTAKNTSGLTAQIPFQLDVKDLGPPKLSLSIPSPKTVRQNTLLSFKVFATDPDKLDRIKLGSSGLPRSVKLTQISNKTGIVLGIVTAKPGMYHVTFTASDGKHPPTKKALTIKVKPNQLKVAVGKTVHLSGGRLPVVCHVAHPSIRSCKATVLVNGKSVGSATGSTSQHGKKSLTVRVGLNGRTLQKINRSKHGLPVRIHIVATKFGSNSRLTADGLTIARKP